MSDYIQLAAVRGNQENHKPNMVKDDFYTLCISDPKNNIGLRKKSPRIDGEIIFKSNDVSLDYLCLDFTRFCLALLKNSQNLYYDQMSLIPKKPIPISQELREYIEEFLPDYYGIRDNVK
jgi:hypothetical protein